MCIFYIVTLQQNNFKSYKNRALSESSDNNQELSEGSN